MVRTLAFKGTQIVIGGVHAHFGTHKTPIVVEVGHKAGVKHQPRAFLFVAMAEIRGLRQHIGAVGIVEMAAPVAAQARQHGIRRIFVAAFRCQCLVFLQGKVAA